MNRHLIIKLSAIGDVIIAIPGVLRLKQERGGEIWWVSGKTAAPILRRYSFIDRVIEVDDAKLLSGSFIERMRELWRVWLAVGGRSFRTCNLLQYDKRYQVLILPVRHKNALILKRGDRSREAIRGRSTTDELGRLLLGLDGQIPVRLNPVPMPGLPEKSNEGPVRVGIVPGGARNVVRDSPLRRWPLQHYRSLAQLFLGVGINVTLVGASSDRWTLGEFEGLDVDDQLGECSITGSIELISKLDLFVTHDTGLMHMAGLTSTPTIALFGPTSPREVLPNRADFDAMWGGELLACRPCYDGFFLPSCEDNVCLRELTPERVFEKATAKLASAALTASRFRQTSPGQA